MTRAQRLLEKEVDRSLQNDFGISTADFSVLVTLRGEFGAAGRRTGITLTPSGHEMIENAIRGHEVNIRRLALDRLSPEQAGAIGAWNRGLIEQLAPAPAESDWSRFNDRSAD